VGYDFLDTPIALSNNILKFHRQHKALGVF
jgi:hypothetical protein